MKFSTPVLGKPRRRERASVPRVGERLGPHPSRRGPVTAAKGLFELVFDFSANLVGEKEPSKTRSTATVSAWRPQMVKFPQRRGPAETDDASSVADV